MSDGVVDGAVGVAGLAFADLLEPGISRARAGDGWHYHSPDGKRIRDAETIARLNRVALPPAYLDAWYCPDPRGHIQAVGTDARGRRQYRYHPDFRATRDGEKFDRCAEFGAALPRLRARVARDLALRGACRERVVAAVVRLLDRGRIRVGNRQYLRDNRSHGATTLKNEQAAVRGERVRLRFRGKSGKLHDRLISDRALAAVVRRCQDLPGQSLFTWADAEGVAHPVGSADVNAYIREAMGDGFSAKHFRTWWASVIALQAALDGLPAKAAVALVADELGNTPAIARNSYVHPQVLAILNEGAPPRLPARRATAHLGRAERALLDLLAGATPQRAAA